MKREIKFRGLRTNGKGWIYGMPTYYFKYIFNSKHLDSPDNYEVIPETVGQFTGLKDKNGVDIYEGDLRQIKGKLYKIVNFGWCFSFERNLVEFGENENLLLDEDTAYESFLIGNIHENKI